RLAYEDRELLVERPVEAVVGGEVFLRLRRQGVRALGHGVEWAAWRGVHDQEGHERHREQGRYQPQDAGDDVLEHALPPTPRSERGMSYYLAKRAPSQGAAAEVDFVGGYGYGKGPLSVEEAFMRAALEEARRGR